jgi:energy-converting hydrogenase Eha subunit C
MVLFGGIFIMSLPIRVYLSTLAQNTHRMCKFIEKHKTVMINVVATVSPSDVAAVTAAFEAIGAACDVFIRVMQLIDPNWKPQ